MELASCAQMKEIDRMAIEEIGIPGIVLMENAALQVVKEIEKTLHNVCDKNIMVFCSKGNNGGDGFAIARHLYNKGANTTVVFIGDAKDIKGDARINFEIIQNMGVKILKVENDTDLAKIKFELQLCDLVVDSILGTGIKGKISGIFEQVISSINASDKTVIAVDIPSGINGDTGQICGICVRAHKTVTFALPKIGLLIYPAADFVGELIVADISIPYELIKKQNIHVFTMGKQEIQKMIPKRRNESNKGDYGKVFIVAGSKGMTGAATLAAFAALRTGSGLVTVGIPASLNEIMEVKLTEAMTLPLEDEGKGILSSSSADTIISKMSQSDVVVFGPGLSTGQDILDILSRILPECRVPIIIDADGINALASNINILKDCRCPVIITPHPGEMSRLTKIAIPDIQSNRLEIAKKFAQEWQVTVVLKGARTVIACSNGHLYINCTGNPGMATGGSGDVLAGIIASLIGQGLDVDQGTIAAVNIHGMAGDQVAKEKGECGLLPSDIIEVLPTLLKNIHCNKSNMTNMQGGKYIETV